MEAISNRYLGELSEKERKTIDKVLEQYDFQTISCSKVRSVYKIETTSGIICLKRIKHGRHKPNNGSILVQELIERNFYNIAKYYKTKDGRVYVRHKKVLFYVTEWIDGVECDLNNIDEALNCVKLLAEFHVAANSVDTSKLRVKNNLINWPKKFNESVQDLEKFHRVIDRKRIKSEFDSIYSSHIDSFYYRGMISLNFLNTSDYYRLSKEASKNKSICHDSFYYQNIIKRDSSYYIIDLDSIMIDLHVNDLGKLIRRLMSKKSYQWDFEKARRLIDAYASVNKLSKSELEVMLALIIFPHKFWKLGKRRYIKHKGWDEAKYMRKLTKLIKYNELQIKFLEDYLSFLKEYQ